jgi:hypothetical protein
MRINWKAGVRRLFIVLAVPCVLIGIVAAASDKSVPGGVLVIVLAVVAYCFLEMVIWAVSGFTQGSVGPAPQTLDVEGRTRTFHAFDIVTAERFHLMDADGTLRGYLAIGKQGPMLTFADGDHVRLQIGLEDGQPYVVLMDQGEARVRINSKKSGLASVVVLDAKGVERAALAVAADGSSILQTWDDEEVAALSKDDEADKPTE